MATLITEGNANYHTVQNTLYVLAFIILQSRNKLLKQGTEYESFFSSLDLTALFTCGLHCMCLVMLSLEDEDYTLHEQVKELWALMTAMWSDLASIKNGASPPV